jgi:hypothetical protein
MSPPPVATEGISAHVGAMTKPEIQIKEAVEVYGNVQDAATYRYVARGYCSSRGRDEHG